MKDIKPYLAGLCVAVIFGFSFLFTKEALDLLTPFHLLGFRFATAALMLTILYLVGFIELDFRNKQMGKLVLLGLFQPVIYFICETLGINLTTASEAGMMVALIPVSATIMSAIFLDEKPAFKEFLCILASVAGVVFIVALRTGLRLSGHLLGLFLLLGAVIAAGFYNVLSRKSSVEFKPIEITFVMMWIGAVVFNGIALFQHYQQGDLGSYLVPLQGFQGLIPILYLGVLSSVAAFFMVNFMLSRLRAYEASVFTNLTTIISVAAGVIIRGEPFYWFHLVGGLLIILGVWGTNYFKEKEKNLSRIRQEYRSEVNN